MIGTLPSSELVAALKAAAEPTRLRILALLADAELNVKDLTQILGQSQPRISRHLKLLTEAGLIERFRDGSWVYFHVSDRTECGRLALRVTQSVDGAEAVLGRDRDRCLALKSEREAEAQGYFAAHAADWNRIRALHVAEHEVESAMLEALGPGPF
jgi:DNA-binding transcriptional ArsR family regulator